MKSKTKLISVLIISAFLLLTSCVANNQTEPPVNDLNGTAPQTTSSTQTTTSPEAELAKPYIDIYQLTMSTYDEYHSFISSTKLPSDFVYFDCIDQFGEFDNLVILSPSERGDYSSYLYGFEGGLSLYVYHDRTIDDEVAQCIGYGLTFTSDVNKSDIRTVETKEKKMFLENGFLYVYLQGELSSIRWQSDGILYILSGPEFDSSDEAKKLLKTETAAEVVEKLSEKISSSKK